MIWSQDWKTPLAGEVDTDKLLKLQMGAMSPLWLAFAGFATVGAALWSATHWMRLATMPVSAGEAAAPVAERAEFAEAPPPPEVPVEAPVALDPVVEAPIAPHLAPPHAAPETAEAEPAELGPATPEPPAPEPAAPPAAVAKPGRAARVARTATVKAAAVKTPKAASAPAKVDGRTKAARAAKAASPAPAPRRGRPASR